MNSPSLTDLSSDLSSVGSLSPPPPMDYPSPPSTQDSVLDDSGSQPSSRKRSREPEEQEPVKKRRKAEPKPRTTEYLDFQCGRDPTAADQTAQLNTLLKVLRNRKKVVVIAGAGISVSAGIPDFRSASGLFASLKSEHNLKASGKHLFDASVYQTDSSTTSFHSMVRNLSQLASKAKPTAFHHLLATLGEQGRLLRLYTQNVDGIDTSLTPLATSVPLASKGPWPRTIQLHGGLEKMVCSKCNHLEDFEPSLFDGPQPPPCTHCVETDKVRTDHAGKRSHGIGRLRPRIVLYNEYNPDDEAIGTVVGSDLRARPDAVIVVGTSMKIPGVKRIVREMCGVVRARRDGVAVWVNHDPPPVGKEFEDCWDLVVKGSSDDVAALANMRHWDDDGIDFKCCTESEAEKAMQEQGIQVLIESQQKNPVPLMPTPAPSPGPKPSQPQSKFIFSKLQHIEIPRKTKESSSVIASACKTGKSATKPPGRPSIGKKSRAKLSDPSSNAKINMAYKVTKPRQVHSDGVKNKLSRPLFNNDQLDGPAPPLPADVRPKYRPNPISMVEPMTPGLRLGERVTLQDLELLGPVKVVIAPKLTFNNTTFSIPVTTVDSYDTGVVSPTRRLPTGMAMLLH
ncbi:MAG: hypothetical protein Q9222_004867 [Ikaeria aurantiellina]